MHGSEHLESQAFKDFSLLLGSKGIEDLDEDVNAFNNMREMLTSKTLLPFASRIAPSLFPAYPPMRAPGMFAMIKPSPAPLRHIKRKIHNGVKDLRSSAQ